MKGIVCRALTSLVLGAGLCSTAAGARAAVSSDAEFATRLGAVRESVAQAVSKARASRAVPGRPEGAVVRDQTVVAPVALNETTVKCSVADYSEPMLKVLVPALAELTILNHRNTREGAPCVAAGPCREMSPHDILRQGPGVDQVPIRVVLRKVTELDGAVCRVSLVETVTAPIRGVPFFHERRQQVEDRLAADCR